MCSTACQFGGYLNRVAVAKFSELLIVIIRKHLQLTVDGSGLLEKLNSQLFFGKCAAVIVILFNLVFHTICLLAQCLCFFVFGLGLIHELIHFVADHRAAIDDIGTGNPEVFCFLACFLVLELHDFLNHRGISNFHHGLAEIEVFGFDIEFTLTSRTLLILNLCLQQEDLLLYFIDLVEVLDPLVLGIMFLQDSRQFAGFIGEDGLAFGFGLEKGADLLSIRCHLAGKLSFGHTLDWIPLLSLIRR